MQNRSQAAKVSQNTFCIGSHTWKRCCGHQ